MESTYQQQQYTHLHYPQNHIPSSHNNALSSYQLLDAMKQEIISKVIQQINSNKNNKLMMITNCKIWNQVYSNGEILQNRLDKNQQQQKELQSNIISCIKDCQLVQAESIQYKFKDVQSKLDVLIQQQTKNQNQFGTINTKLSNICNDIINLKKNTKTIINKSSNNNTKINKAIKEITNIKHNYMNTYQFV